LTFGLAQMTTAIRAQAVNGPHVVFGALRGGVRGVSAAIRTYIVDGIRSGRPLAAPIIYNTWYALATELDADGVRDVMQRAAMLGVETFVLDAGWYAGAGTNNLWDFDTGLGVWEPDPERFPDGLAPLSDLAHSLGMKFGLWMEPDRVNLASVGRAGLAQESWLATHDGDYGSAFTARICLSGAGRDWVLSQISHVVETAHIDYLKWDSNLWVNCDRTGHGHGAHDGNFADTTGYYAVLAALRERFPDLLIENCGGGGVRLDLGMLRYTDVGWVDDRTGPSARVRHNLEGLTTIFPPAYLLSFVVERDDEPLHNGPDLMLYFRSRMLGTLGMSFDLRGFPNGYWDTMTRAIGNARDARDATGMLTGMMLTPQAKDVDGPGWDVVQHTSDDCQRIVIWAFQSDPGVNRFVLKPVGLIAGATYDVWSADLGSLDSATGAVLASDGIELEASADSASHLLILTARPD
jgi:alpha-galactosidase